MGVAISRILLCMLQGQDNDHNKEIDMTVKQEIIYYLYSIIRIIEPIYQERYNDTNRMGRLEGSGGGD